MTGHRTTTSQRSAGVAAAVATLRAYLRDLTHDGHAYRSCHDERPLGETDRSFLLCGLRATATPQRGVRRNTESSLPRSRSGP